MKKLFYTGIAGFVLFEIAQVYFIMPMPGSQEMNSLALAYFLHHWRWVFRATFGLLAILGANAAFSVESWKKTLPVLALATAAFVAYATRFEMAADTMFYQPRHLRLAKIGDSPLDSNRLVLGIERNGAAKAYPIQYLGYHHQVRDSLGGKPVMVTYCTVCRTGRVFEPLVNGRTETFRLVGMDHYNAMFEDETTRSWWRQVTGEAVAGTLKGQRLPEIPALQTTLAMWSELHPNTLVMLPDTDFEAEYDSLSKYESGRRTGRLTRRDSASWKEKSWVVGVEAGPASKAFDWNDLQKRRIIHDDIGGQPIVLALSADGKSFAALYRTSAAQRFELHRDTLVSGGLRFNFEGKSLQPDVPDLPRAKAYQEYWHSWRTFHPGTTR